MIRYVSSFSVKTLHAMVNRNLLRMLASVRPDTEIAVEATASTVDMLRGSLPDGVAKTVRFRKLHVNSCPGRMALLARYLQSAWCNISALCRSKKGDTLIYNFNNVFSLSAINRLARSVFKKRNIIIVCHGEMEYLANASSHKKAYKHLMAHLTNSFFLRTPEKKLYDRLHFIVLGDSIAGELKEFLPEHMWRRFLSVDHPIDAPGTVMDNNGQGNKIRLGTVGIMNRYKGADTYLRIIKEFKNRHDMEFSIAGQIQSDFEEFSKLGVRMARNPHEALPDDEFKQMVSELDFILLFYPSDNYRLIASGAVLDTIRFHKPLIAISTPYFRYISDKFGSVGYLADNEKQMSEIISQAPTLPRDKFDFDNAIKQLSAEALAPRFDEILKACGT